jgi:hypothetical protein
MAGIANMPAAKQGIVYAMRAKALAGTMVPADRVYIGITEIKPNDTVAFAMGRRMNVHISKPPVCLDCYDPNSFGIIWISTPMPWADCLVDEILVSAVEVENGGRGGPWSQNWLPQIAIRQARAIGQIQRNTMLNAADKRQCVYQATSQLAPDHPLREHLEEVRYTRGWQDPQFRTALSLDAEIAEAIRGMVAASARCSGAAGENREAAAGVSDDIPNAEADAQPPRYILDLDESDNDQPTDEGAGAAAEERAVDDVIDLDENSGDQPTDEGAGAAAEERAVDDAGIPAAQRADEAT